MRQDVLVCPETYMRKIYYTKAGNLTEWKLLAAIFWLLNPVVIMTKLLRNEMKAMSTDHEGRSNKNYKLAFFSTRNLSEYFE